MSAGSIVVETAPTAAAALVEAVLTVAVSIELDISTAVIVLVVTTMFTVVRQASDVPKFEFLGTFEQFG